MFISKKDLLGETGISYGQLYRWKREGLIPERWFIKKPSFTGQETFFPRDKILARIRAINELKNKYSLEELAKIMSPEVSERYFTQDDLREINEIDKGLIPMFHIVLEKDSFSFIEVLFLITISRFRKERELSLRDTQELFSGIKENIGALNNTDAVVLLLELNGVLFTLVQPEQASVSFDARVTKIGEVRLNDISTQMKLRYRKRFNLTFEEDAPRDDGHSLVLIENGEL